MRIFERFPEQSTCFICGSNEDKPCALIADVKTQEGFTCKADVVHIDCLELGYEKLYGDIIIFQRVEGRLGDIHTQRNGVIK